MIVHADEPLVFRGQQANDRRLDDGHERHVGIGRHHDCADVFRIEEVGHEYGGGAVRRADDGDGGRVLQVKAQKGRQAEREEYAELRRRAEDHQLRIGQKRRKVDHCADADEQKQREQLVGDARAEEHIDDAGLCALSDRAGERQVDQNRAEAHGQQQRRLHVLGDGQIDQHAADDPHDRLLPGDVEDVREQFQHGSASFRDVGGLSIYKNEAFIESMTAFR